MACKSSWRELSVINTCMKEVAKALEQSGNNKIADQCGAKIKKLRLDYRKVKDKHNKTGRGRSNWKFFHALGRIRGHRPATKPAVVLDTSEDQQPTEEVSDHDDYEEEDADEMSMLDQCTTYSTTATTEEGTDDGQPSQSFTKTSTLTATGIKGKKKR